VIRLPLRGHNDTPFGQPTPGRPIGRPGVGRPLGVFGGFSYYQLVIIFGNIVPLIIEFTYSNIGSAGALQHEVFTMWTAIPSLTPGPGSYDRKLCLL
jgi:hypothetical protein